MRRERSRDVLLQVGSLAASLLVASAARAQGPAQPSPQIGPNSAPCASSGGSSMTVHSIEQLVRMSPQELDALYQCATVGPVPAGKVRGRIIIYPGKALAVPFSKAARLVWQGKIFGRSGDTVVNKFFGVRAIKGNVYQGESWRDGRPSLIIDYSETSLLYANYRDEIRQVAPGLYLGLMYARTRPQPTFKMYFALECGP